jgi:uncharacterized membrane-anchored protein
VAVGRDQRAVRARRGARDAATRVLAVTALVLAVWFVVAVTLEAREPSSPTPALHIQPLPTNLVGP